MTEKPPPDRQMILSDAPDLPVPSATAMTPMALMQHAIDRGASPEALQQLYALHKQVQADEAAALFADRLAAFQQDCPQIRKMRAATFGGGDTAYHYAALDDIMRQIQPLLTKHGLTPAFSADLSEDGKITAICTIRCGIHEHRSTVTLPTPSGVKVNDTQRAGMALSYAKRYALCMALNIVVTDEDNDAQHMGEPITEQQAIQIQEMLEACDGDLDGFLRFAGAPSIPEIPASAYKRCIDALRKKAGGK